MAISEEWSIPCLADNEELEPTPNELDAMYKKLSAGETFELSWKCTGRRLPTPVQVADTEVKNNSNTAKSSKNLEFDFMDEVAAPTMRIQRPIATAKSTVKKKTANFAGVLDSMKKKNQRL